MEIESLRRATLAALRVKYREVFQEETRVRAQQIAQDADLRMIAPRDFVIVEGERVRTVQGVAMRNFKALGSILLAKDMAERKLNLAEVQQYRTWIDAIAERAKQQTAALKASGLSVEGFSICWLRVFADAGGTRICSGCHG
jgi:hypothetical protein